jgi:hypothetical protein
LLALLLLGISAPLFVVVAAGVELFAPLDPRRSFGLGDTVVFLVVGINKEFDL